MSRDGNLRGLGLLALAGIAGYVLIALSVGDLQRNRVALEAVLAPDLPAVTGDRIELQQVISNLLRNALDAMATLVDRPRKLVVTTEPEDADRVRVSVRDTGVGIDPEGMSRLFDAFYTTKSEGMGMGLSISRSIVEAHGGRMWAESNAAGGATFRFTLPAAPSES